MAKPRRGLPWCAPRIATPEELLQRRLAREISARQQAETLLEQKSLELYIEAQERQAALLQLQESEERYR
jgi:hypothetical protein